MGILDELAGKNPAQVPPTPGAGEALQARAELAAELPKRKRGRPRKDQGGSGTAGVAGPGASPQLTEEVRAQLEQCYDPKAWGALLTMPADLMMTLTGGKHWDVSKDERDTLGAAGSTAARFMTIDNPRTLAFLMLGSALFTVYVPRALMEMKARKDAADNDAAKQG